MERKGELVICSGSISNSRWVEEKPAEVSSLLPFLKPTRLRSHCARVNTWSVRAFIDWRLDPKTKAKFCGNHFSMVDQRRSITGFNNHTISITHQINVVDGTKLLKIAVARVCVCVSWWDLHTDGHNSHLTAASNSEPSRARWRLILVFFSLPSLVSANCEISSSICWCRCDRRWVRAMLETGSLCDHARS